MKRCQIVFIGLSFFISSLLYAGQTDVGYKYRINMVRYSTAIIEGRVTGMTDEKDSYNCIHQVVSVQVKNKIAGEDLKSTLTLSYLKNWQGDAIWYPPTFNAGDTFIAFLAKGNDYYYPLGGAYGIFKVYNDNIEKSAITVDQFCRQLMDVRNCNAESLEFPIQYDIEVHLVQINSAENSR